MTAALPPPGADAPPELTSVLSRARSKARQRTIRYAQFLTYDELVADERVTLCGLWSSTSSCRGVAWNKRPLPRRVPILEVTPGT